MLRYNLTDPLESDPFGELYLANGGEFGLTSGEVAAQLHEAAQTVNDGMGFATLDAGTSISRYVDTGSEAHERVTQLMARPMRMRGEHYFFICQRARVVGEAVLRPVVYNYDPDRLYYPDSDLRQGVKLTHQLDLWCLLDNGLPRTVVACANMFLRERVHGLNVDGVSDGVSYSYVDYDLVVPEMAELERLVTTTVCSFPGKMARLLCEARPYPDCDDPDYDDPEQVLG